MKFMTPTTRSGFLDYRIIEGILELNLDPPENKLA
jgi:hypothetical protein